MFGSVADSTPLIQTRAGLAVASLCCAVTLHAGVKGVGGPVTKGGQGKGRGPVRCAPVVVAPDGGRGSGSGPGIGGRMVAWCMVRGQ